MNKLECKWELDIWKIWNKARIGNWNSKLKVSHVIKNGKYIEVNNEKKRPIKYSGIKTSDYYYFFEKEHVGILLSILYNSKSTFFF